jgi:hypothetical protein
MRKPKYNLLRVIDRAIERIEARRDTMTCCALYGALSDHKWNYLGQDVDLLADQWEKYNRHKDKGGKLPAFWNRGYSPKRKQARLKALRGFRQACIDAGQGKFLA